MDLTAPARQKTYRARRARGVVVLPVEVRAERLAARLTEEGLIHPEQANDKAALAAAVASLVEQL